MIDDGLETEVGGEEEDHVLAVDDPPFPIRQLALVERLIEEVEHVRMGFFHLIQQHHRVGLLPNGFGQHATLAKADIAGRRTDQTGDGVLLLILGHVDGGEILATAKHQLGNLQHGFGLADPAWPHQQEGAQRTAWTTQIGAGGQQVLVQMGHRHILPLDELAKVLRQTGHYIELPWEMRLSGTPVHSAITAAT